MFSIITGSLIISVLHAIIPNHWLPVIAIGRKEGWTTKEVTTVTLTCALAHGLSTIMIGFIISYIGQGLESRITAFQMLIAPAVLVVMGLIFIYRHHRHRHFHLNDPRLKKRSKTAIISALVIAMFFSPCLEIEAYFLIAGTHSAALVGIIALLYLVITTTGMLLLVRFAYQGLLKLNWHSLEHNAGIITGVTLVATGILSFFIQ